MLPLIRAQGKNIISRYHAADCSNYYGEFEDWTPEEQKQLTAKLLGVFSRYFTNVIACSVSIDDFIKEFPESKDRWMEQCYGFMLKFLMIEIADQFTVGLSLKQSNESITIALIHDRSSYDGTLLRASNQLMVDPGFKGLDFFSTIAPLPSKDCIPLQAADLLAYENLKDSESHLFTKRRRRFTLTALLASQLGGRSRTIDAAGVRKLREVLEKSQIENKCSVTASTT